MKIAEIFYSVQGEGTLVGVPSVFVRVSGCNLRCTWCDTPYASWDPQGVDMSLDAILREVSRNSACTHTVLTGGEPMIFPELPTLTREIKNLGHHVTIETAGTVFQTVECDLMSISPKLASSTPRERDGGRWAELHERLRYQPAILRQLMAEYDYQLKFVVTDASDMDELRQIVRHCGADQRNVILMPEGIDPESLRKRSKWLIETCKAEGFRFSPRLHIDVWGNIPGR